MNINKLFSFNFDLVFIKVTMKCLVLFLLAGFSTAYANSPAEQGLEKRLLSLQSRNSAVRASFVRNAQTDPIVGGWRYYSNLSGMRCVTESVVQANGRYSSTTSCNNGVYFTYLTGTWGYLQRGVIRIQYNNARYSDGRRHIPDGETVYFSFINRNQIRLGNGIIASRIG